MEGEDFIRTFRQRADDNASPRPLFSDAQILAFASEAEKEAAFRAKLIFDTSRPSICFIPVLAGVTEYKLDPRIIEVASVRLDRSAQYPGMHPRHLRLVDQSNAIRGRRIRDYGNCAGLIDEFGLGSRLSLYAIDGETLRLYGVPDTTYITTPASYLRLEVYRLPLEDLSEKFDEFEIPHVHQDGLMDWALYRAYGNKDGEEVDDNRSSLAYARFEQRFGPRKSASAHRMQQEGRRWTTSYGGIR